MPQEARMSSWRCFGGSEEIRFEGEAKKSNQRLQVDVPIAVLAKLGEAAIRFVEGKKVSGAKPSEEPSANHLFWHIEPEFDRPFAGCSSCGKYEARGPVTPSGLCPVDGEAWEKHDEAALGNHALRMWRNEDMPKEAD